MIALADATDARRFGGKAAELARALRAGLPVPAGVALDADAVLAIVNGAPLGDHPVGPLAVRSSAIGEDSAAASFAGVHATVLGGSDVRAAIEHVHASAFTPAAAAYRARLGVVGPPRMAIVVQRLVDADAAGVMFTRHPVSGADELLVEGAWGLGEAVVSGLVDPDRARVDRRGRILEATTGEKDVAIRRQADGTCEVPLPPELRARSCLDERTLRALVDVARRCDEVWSGPHDIEWAMADGELWLLQRRPITSRP